MRYVLSVLVASITWCSFKGAAKKGLGVAAVVALAFLPSSQADADIVVNATGIVTESTQVVPGTPFDFNAIIDEDAPDALPDFDGIGAFQDNPFESFTLQIGIGDNAVLIEGAGGDITIAPLSGLGGLRIGSSDVNSIEGLPDEFMFGSFAVNFENVTFANDTLIDGLNALANNNNGTFSASLSPTSAFGNISSFSVTTTSVPEPSCLALLAIVAVGVAARRSRNDNGTNGYGLVA